MLFSISSLLKSQEPTNRFSTQSMIPGSVPVGPVLDRVGLGAGLIYSIEDVLDLEVDYGLTSTELTRRMGLQPEWRYAGQTPSAGKRIVHAAIGRLSGTWTELQLTNLLNQPECPLQGSGAWVREAFLAARPRYDGRGSVLFPDAASSRWRRRLPNADGDLGVSFYSICFPGLEGLSDGSWRRSLLWVKPPGARPSASASSIAPESFWQRALRGFPHGPRTPRRGTMRSMKAIESPSAGVGMMKRLAARRIETLRTTAALYDCGGARERPGPPPIVRRETDLDQPSQQAAKLLEFGSERRSVAS